MSHNNSQLEKYEIKKPDYEYINRDSKETSFSAHSPKRFVKKGDKWVGKSAIGRLFQRKHARIMFVGDITCFDKQFEAAKTQNGYDFSYEFDNVRPIFEKADLVVGNLETMIFPNAPYRSEKFVSEQNFHCNAPIEFLDAVRKAGFDVVTNANNHDLDTGAVGIGETIDNVEKMGLIQTGTFKTDKKRYEIIDVLGFKIAIVAFATEHNGKKNNLTSEGAQFLLNDYSEENSSKIIKEAKADGAELVFVCIHWGRENKTKNNDKQTQIADQLIEAGADCIIGSHPHVLQPFEIRVSSKSIVPVFYSLGNFVSHNVNNQKARSIIACIDLTRINGEIVIDCSYIPIFTAKQSLDKEYVVLPISENSSNAKNISIRDKITNVMGKEISINSEIDFPEYIDTNSESNSLEKPEPINCSELKSFPVIHDNGKFVYEINKDSCCINGLSPMNTAFSCSIKATFAERPVKNLKVGAFSGNNQLKKINFSKSLSVIPKQLCKDCKSLEGFQIGSRIAEIQTEAFSGCTSLTCVVIKDSVKKIESRAFAGCEKLISVKISSNILDIADDAFEGCNRATFYCPEDSYAEKYAKTHGFNVINMEL